LQRYASGTLRDRILLISRQSFQFGDRTFKQLSHGYRTLEMRINMLSIIASTDKSSSKPYVLDRIFAV